jgi:hypothetical protein
MKYGRSVKSTLILLSLGFAIAARAESPAEPTIPPVLAKVTVTSKYYGSFTKEGIVKVNHSISFDNFGARHPAIVYHGKCSVKRDASGRIHDIDDGVQVNVTPVLVSPDGIVGAQTEVTATKFIGYNTVDTGKLCGDIAFVKNDLATASTALLYHGDEGHVVFEAHDHTDREPDKDIRVTVSFSPAEASSN